MVVVGSIAWRQGILEDCADADRVDRFRLAVVEDCRRKGPIHSSARIDVAAVVAHVRPRLLRIKIDRRRMTVDNVFRERSPVTKEAVANPKLGFGGLLVEGHARMNSRMNIIADFVFMAGLERAHPFLRLPDAAGVLKEVMVASPPLARKFVRSPSDSVA